MQAVSELGGRVGVRQACDALSVPAASYYRWRRPNTERSPRPAPPLKLSASEERQVLDVLHSERFVDHAPEEVYATLLDEQTYICSARTMYRVLERHQEVRERRRQLVHPPATKPELLARRPNEVWSWDITKLRGPVKWSYFYLYVMLDIFSRLVVGWLVAEREWSGYAKRLIAECYDKQGIEPGQLTIHSDRGSPMIAKTTGQLLANLGITKTHSRPYTSNDNPYSEAMFRTAKYRPQFPDRFGSIQDVIGFGREFFPWYNGEHRHSGIGYLTPEVMHYGAASEVIEARGQALAAAFDRHPQRFKGRMPAPPAVPTEAWINPPNLNDAAEGGLQVCPASDDCHQHKEPAAPEDGGKPTAGVPSLAEGSRLPVAMRSGKSPPAGEVKSASLRAAKRTLEVAEDGDTIQPRRASADDTRRSAH